MHGNTFNTAGRKQLLSTVGPILSFYLIIHLLFLTILRMNNFNLAIEDVQNALKKVLTSNVNQIHKQTPLQSANLFFIQ